MSQPSRTSGLAIASLILGVLGFVSFGLLGVVGAILGIIALTSIAGSNRTLRGRGFAVAGIIVSACSLIVGCIGLLAALTLPAIGKARQNAMAAAEQASLRNIYVAMAMYGAENRDELPPFDTWDAVLAQDYMGSSMPFLSPRDRDAGRCFALNAGLKGFKFEDISDPALTVMVFECDFGSAPAGGAELLPDDPRYSSGYSILFADGQVEQVYPDRIETLIWIPNE